MTDGRQSGLVASIGLTMIIAGALLSDPKSPSILESDHAFLEDPLWLIALRLSASLEGSAIVVMGIAGWTSSLLLRGK